jgi:hypothetical protein
VAITGAIFCTYFSLKIHINVGSALYPMAGGAGSDLDWPSLALADTKYTSKLLQVD